MNGWLYMWCSIFEKSDVIYVHIATLRENVIMYMT